MAELSADQFGLGNGPEHEPDDDFPPLSDDDMDEIYDRWKENTSKPKKPRMGDEQNPKPIEPKPEHWVPRAPPGYHTVKPPSPTREPRQYPGRQPRPPDPMTAVRKMRALSRTAKGKRR